MDYTPGHSRLSEDAQEHERFAPVLAENVKRLRKQAKINKKTFALMVGIGRPFLNKIENGTADARLSVITKMADALDTTPSYLLTEHAHTGKPDEAFPPHPAHHARLA